MGLKDRHMVHRGHGVYSGSLVLSDSKWDLFEGGRLFHAVKDKVLSDELHLAEMVSLMGPPPKRFLERSQTCARYWDGEGKYCTIYLHIAKD